MSFQNDYKLGKKHEIKIFEQLCENFGELKQTTEKYAKYDFTNDQYEIELKTRNNTKGKYPTTMIAKDKVTDTTKKIIFIFNFTDGCYYIEYNKDIFDKFEKTFFKRPNRCDKIDIKKYYLLIPIELLIQL